MPRIDVGIVVRQGAEINGEHPEGVNALMYGAAGAHMGVVQVSLISPMGSPQSTPHILSASEMWSL